MSTTLSPEDQQRVDDVMRSLPDSPRRMPTVAELHRKYPACSEEYISGVLVALPHPDAELIVARAGLTAPEPWDLAERLNQSATRIGMTDTYFHDGPAIREIMRAIRQQQTRIVELERMLDCLRGPG